MSTPDLLPAAASNQGLASAIAVRGAVETLRRDRGGSRHRSRYKQGEIFGLIGPDGAGKTSTFQILAGVMEATSGTARVFREAGARGTLAHRLSDAGIQPLSGS